MQTTTLSTSDTTSPVVAPMGRRTIHFAGRVQGVGFRYTARNIALQYDVRGYVRNLPDGRVELVLEGSEPQIDRVVEELRRKMSCFVRGVTMQNAPATGEFDQFSIRH
ncbi:acylphosphatase [Humisphaera borealis]|uniref:acylphosphatase n=2 Tax=Humisphaera borealis TaxID=2807512 RepID=A0A7M2WWR0_9BACT|nr:acylphosphatase [Humisphaera borealis]